jgi:hypothetical protein
MSTEEKIKIMREAPHERLMNPEDPSIEEISYEKEPESAKPTNYILPELARKSMSTKESDPHTTRV